MARSTKESTRSGHKHGAGSARAKKIEIRTKERAKKRKSTAIRHSKNKGPMTIHDLVLPGIAAHFFNKAGIVIRGKGLRNALAEYADELINRVLDNTITFTASGKRVRICSDDVVHALEQEGCYPMGAGEHLSRTHRRAKRVIAVPPSLPASPSSPSGNESEAV